MRAFIVGAGTMGSGIAQVFAANRWDTGLCDLTVELAAAGKTKIEKGLARLVDKGKMAEGEMTDILSRIRVTCDVADAAGCDLVIEASAEDMKIKSELFARLDSVCGTGAILATNTSSLSVTEIASATKHPARVVGMHFFNPAPVMKLIEVIRGAETSTETIERIVEIATSVGKTPVQVVESPGFVVNRLLIPMINEAIGVLAEGVASAEDIDKAMVLGANHPIGPLGLSDLIGNDITLAIMDTLHQDTGDPKYRAHTLLRKMVRAGRLGKKTGRGFFDY
jgi:3-hydroxybutyryl-CoA dehydrogenase